jgi:hypothetical protein
MKLDMDLVRKILLKVEASESGEPGRLSIEGYSSDQTNYHIGLLVQAALLTGESVTTMSDKYAVWFVCSMTLAGHEFVGAARDEGRWARARSVAEEIPLAELTKLLLTMATQDAQQHVLGANVPF